MPRSVRILTAVFMAVAVAACAEVPPSPSPTPSASAAAAVPDKPVTLRVANGEGGGSPESKAVVFFADEVARASGGTITVEPIEDEQPDLDNDNRVASGEIDAAITQARSWDALDVTSLQALQTPFLITNEAAAAAATDGDIAARLMSGLTAKGVDGLALWAIDFRHPVSFREPFLSLADFKGTKIRIVGSTITEEVMSALGAEAVRPEGEWAAQVEDGTIKGAETAFDRVSTLPRIGTMTGNVTFYPRVDVFFVNHATFSRMSPAQQDAVRTAAAATRQHVVEGIVPDAEQAAGYCATDGGTVVLASPADLAAMGTALEPVRSKLESDPLTKQLIADIAAVERTDLAAAPVAACDPSAAKADGTSTEAKLAGDWHTEPLTDQEVTTAWVAAGGSEADGHAFFAQLGGGAKRSAVIGLTFEDGQLTELEQGDDAPEIVSVHYPFTLSADDVLTTRGECDDTEQYEVVVDGDVLRLTAITPCWPGGPVLFGSFPFHRDGGGAAAKPPNPFKLVATLPAARTGVGEVADMDVGADGRLYVVDSRPRVSVLSPKGKVLASWGKAGSGPGEFDFAGGPGTGIAVGPDRLVYVSDGGNGRVQVFRPDGTFVRQFGTAGTDEGEFGWAYQLGVDEKSNAYVLDGQQLTLSKFGPKGAFVWRIGGALSPDPDLRDLEHGARVDDQGRIWVAEDAIGRVVAIDVDGHKVDALGSPGTGVGQLSAPCSVDLDHAGDIYVHECVGDGLEVFDAGHRSIAGWSAEDDPQIAEAFRFAPNGHLFSARHENGDIREFAVKLP